MILQYERAALSKDALFHQNSIADMVLQYKKDIAMQNFFLPTDKFYFTAWATYILTFENLANLWKITDKVDVPITFPHDNKSKT